MKKLYTPESIHLLFGVCWISYFSTYLGRLNFTACIAEMQAADGLSKTALGQVTSAFFVAYGAGQLCSGFLADRFSPRLLVGGGLLGSALLNAGMALSRTAGQMTLLWGLNGLVQAMAWAPLVRTVVDLASDPYCARICLHLATTTPAGTLAAYGVSVLCISFFSWRHSFWFAAVFLTLTAFVWLGGIGALQRLARREGLPEKGAESGGPAGPAHPGGAVIRAVLWSLAPAGAAVFVHGLLKDGILTWTPSFLQENFGFPAAVSVAMTLIVPVVNLTGVYLAGAVHSRWLRNEAATALACFGLCGAGALAWWLAGRASLAVTLVGLLIATTCMTGVSTMLLSLLPLRFRALGLTATLTGLLNAVTYLGSAVSGAGFGALSEAGGWGAVLAAWWVLAALGAAACWPARRRVRPPASGGGRPDVV